MGENLRYYARIFALATLALAGIYIWMYSESQVTSNILISTYWVAGLANAAKFFAISALKTSTSTHVVDD